MNEAIRKDVKARVESKGQSLSAFAQGIDLERQYFNRMLNHGVGDVPDSWQRVFDALGLELVVVPKGSSYGVSDPKNDAQNGGVS